MGGGVAATFLGVALLSPYLVPAAGLGHRAADRGADRGRPGRLARGNTTRQPGRTAVTAAALMIGVALVTFASIFAAGARDSIAKAVDDNLKAGLVVQSDNGFSSFSRERAAGGDRGCPAWPASAPCASRRPRSRATASSRSPASTARASRASTASTSRTAGEAAVRSLARPGTVMVGKGFADGNDLEVGSRLDPDHADERQGRGAGRRRSTTTRAACWPSSRSTTAGWRAPSASARTPSGSSACRPGQDVKVVERRVKGLLDRDFPSTEVLTAKEFKDQQAGQVNQLLGLIYALLVPGHHRLALRDREHARAVDQRAHPRARDAAGHRDVAPAGQADDPLGGGHHVAHRRRGGGGAGHDPGGRSSRGRSTASC